jgi:hypothetical protein
VTAATVAELWLVVPNWNGSTGFQHYRDRVPRWIKNYTELMSDDAYIGLTGHRRGILHGLWLEYASSRCRLAVDTASLSRRLALRVTMKDLEALNHAGFLEFSASAPLAQPEHDASLEVEKKEKPPYPLRAQRQNPAANGAAQTPAAAARGLAHGLLERSGLDASLDWLAANRNISSHERESIGQELEQAARGGAELEGEGRAGARGSLPGEGGA